MLRSFSHRDHNKKVVERQSLLVFIQDGEYWVYILYSETHDKFYVGQTNNADERLERHNAGSVKATAPYVPWRRCLTISKQTRSEAVILERKIKNLSKLRIQSFILKYGGIVPSPDDSQNECQDSDSKPMA